MWAELDCSCRLRVFCSGVSDIDLDGGYHGAEEDVCCADTFWDGAVASLPRLRMVTVRSRAGHEGSVDSDVV